MTLIQGEATASFTLTAAVGASSLIALVHGRPQRGNLKPSSSRQNLWLSQSAIAAVPIAPSAVATVPVAILATPTVAIATLAIAAVGFESYMKAIAI